MRSSLPLAHVRFLSLLAAIFSLSLAQNAKGEPLIDGYQMMTVTTYELATPSPDMTPSPEMPTPTPTPDMTPPPEMPTPTPTPDMTPPPIFSPIPTPEICYAPEPECIPVSPAPGDENACPSGLCCQPDPQEEGTCDPANTDPSSPYNCSFDDEALINYETDIAY